MTDPMSPAHADSAIQSLLENLRGLPRQFEASGINYKQISYRAAGGSDLTAWSSESIRPNGEYSIRFVNFVNPIPSDQISKSALTHNSYFIRAETDTTITPDKPPFCKVLFCENVPLSSKPDNNNPQAFDFTTLNCHLYYNRVPDDKSPIMLTSEDIAKAKNTRSATLVVRNPTTGAKEHSFTCPLDSDGKPVLEDPSKQKGFEMVKQALEEVQDKTIIQRTASGLNLTKTTTVDTPEKIAAVSPTQLQSLNQNQKAV